MKRLERYFAFVQQRPELFVNPKDKGIITILLDKDEIRAVETRMRKRYRKQGRPTKWAKVGIVHHDQYTLILRDAVRFPNGKTGTYFRMVGGHVPGVIILPVYQGRVLLTRHFRHATRQWHLEIPRGFGEEGLSDEENARRELVEETSAEIIHLIPLGHAYPNTGASSECNQFFYAEISSYGAADDHEGIGELLTVTIADLEEMIRDATIDDEFTIIAYTRAKLRGFL